MVVYLLASRTMAVEKNHDFPRGVTDRSILNSMRFNTRFDYELFQ